jgi:hypothetical protein
MKRNCNRSANKSNYPIQNSLLFVIESQTCGNIFVTIFEDESLDVQEEDGHISFSLGTAYDWILESVEEEESKSSCGIIL